MKMRSIRQIQILWAGALALSVLGQNCILDKAPTIDPAAILLDSRVAGCGASGCHFSTALAEFPTTSNAHITRNDQSGGPRGHVYIMDCEYCHFNYATRDTHQDGIIQTTGLIDMRPDIGRSATFNSSDKTCANSGCHVTQAWTGKSGGFNTATSACTDCHGTQYGYAPAPSSGKHSNHINIYFASGGRCSEVVAGLQAQGNLHTCNVCHNGYFTGTNHKNGVVNSGTPLVSFHPTPSNGADVSCDSGTSVTYDGTFCTGACHAAASWK